MPITFFAPAGGDGKRFTFTAETEMALLAGQAIRILPSTRLTLAQADSWTHGAVIGLALADTAAQFAAPYLTAGQLHLADWTAITGYAVLMPGATYFLDPVTPGAMTGMAPTTIGQCVVIIGHALDTLTMNIDIQSVMGL